MAGLMLFENLLDDATYVAAESSAEVTGYEHANCTDGRLDTSADITTAVWDLKSSDQSVTAQSASYTTDASTVTLGNADRREDGFWVGYEIEITSGTETGDTAIIDTYDGTTNIATLATALSGTGTGDYTLTIIYDFDSIGIAGHNLNSINSDDSYHVRVRTGSVQGTYTSTEEISDIKSDDVYLKRFDSLTANRYVEISASAGKLFSVVYIGSSMDMGATYDKFALRPSFTPPGIYQTVKPTINQSNANQPFPSSVRDEPFPVDLNFKYLDADYLRQQLHRGMYESIQKEPFFLAWDVTNNGHDSSYPEVAYCWTDRVIAPPKLTDFNGRFDWKIRAKGLKR